MQEFGAVPFGPPIKWQQHASDTCPLHLGRRHLRAVAAPILFENAFKDGWPQMAVLPGRPNSHEFSYGMRNHPG